MLRVDIRPRGQNSGKSAALRRFPIHLQWLRGRPCAIAGREGHVCEGKVEASHSDADGTKGMSLKSADFHAVPLCSAAHRELHQTGLQTWQAKYKVNHAEQGRAYGRQSPKRGLWAHIDGAPR
jgi:hypothetical protein